ncbi:hypothetical protein B0H66DRAFT_469028 [Apodospora peruviana]|uniref:gamma-glutamylcyclotransferase n=1 Tax=Apodospora peruviana TaxID=516989 RepID=A0AAE0IRJ1_9PEZI|nr:hypothetical protein B0H66DRAFT_469028 [Apodospora peruviana]
MASSAQAQVEPANTALCALGHLRKLYPSPKPSTSTYDPLVLIPRTSVERLSAPDASPTPFPDTHIPASSIQQLSAPPTPATVLYLAYGSNLCAETFLGRRGIRPVSQVNVSCPSLRLTFDLPGLPYLEPCFANTAPRKVPKTPPKLPPDIPDLPKPPQPPQPQPDLPDLPPGTKPPHWHWDTSSSPAAARGNNAPPVWDKGLIGVVYEVTKADYAKIIQTEGGGAGYHDILVPCLPLPASVGVPERPPQVPIPFLAHTLYAPRLPDIPDDDDDDKARNDGDGDDDDDKPKIPIPKWAKRLLLPVRRDKEDYAQPSARYLKLITDGAREHELPKDYQAYLGSLEAYTMTTPKQRIGRVLFLAFWAPFALLLLGATRLFADEKGRVPAWLVGASAILFNLVWISYDVVAKPIFGEGERTIDHDDGGADEERGLAASGEGERKRGRWNTGSARRIVQDAEKRNLLERDW